MFLPTSGWVRGGKKPFLVRLKIGFTRILRKHLDTLRRIEAGVSPARIGEGDGKKRGASRKKRLSAATSVVTAFGW
jgi:hypothetical protein